MAYRVRFPKQNAKTIGRLFYPQKTGDSGVSGGDESRSKPCPDPQDQLAGQPRTQNPTADVDLALKIGGYVARLSACQSATACEIAESFHGAGYTLDELATILRVCEELRGARILIRGRHGYGYQLADVLMI
jgi:hypothetical protein